MPETKLISAHSSSSSASLAAFSSISSFFSSFSSCRSTSLYTLSQPVSPTNLNPSGCKRTRGNFMGEPDEKRYNTSLEEGSGLEGLEVAIKSYRGTI
jgi:hypothetical protein